MNTGLQGKVVLITGGSRGIGRATALMLAAEGARLALCSRDEVQLKHTADEIRSRTHADVIAVKSNMTKLNDIRRFVNAAVKKFSKIDILVNNAGGAHIGGILNTTDEEWEYHIQLKLLGYIRMAREVIPYMKQNGGGRIINIVGMAAREPSPLMMVSGVTHAALLNFSKSLSKELETERILVNSINPTTTDTSLTQETTTKVAAIREQTPEDAMQAIIRSMPQGRIAATEDIARVVVFLASEAANFINGISLNVDSGRSSSPC